MSIQMLEEGLLNNDIQRAIEGFNNMFGKDLPMPEKAKKGDTAKLKSTAKALASVVYSLEEIVADIGKAPVKKKKTAVAEKKEVPEEKTDEEEILEEKMEDVAEEDDEDQDEEFKEIEVGDDEDGNKFTVVVKEEKETPIFRGGTIKTQFVTNEITQAEAEENKKRQLLDKKKPAKNPLQKCENPKCKNVTTNIYTRKGESRILCPKCEKKEILG